MLPILAYTVVTSAALCLLGAGLERIASYLR